MRPRPSSHRKRRERSPPPTFQRRRTQSPARRRSRTPLRTPRPRSSPRRRGSTPGSTGRPRTPSYSVLLPRQGTAGWRPSRRASPYGFDGCPLPGRPDVLLFNGDRKGYQGAHEAVVNIDVGTRDLQQCADAVMRLRAEYLRAVSRDDEICFRFTNGSDAVWTRWREGERPRQNGRKTAWKRTARPDAAYDSFKRYLIQVFQYAGTASLEREMTPVDPADRVKAGDVFIEGGFPGHAVIVVDVAESSSGERVFLLLQSYMPAQQMHILKNPAADSSLSPWYRYVPDEPLWTPEWRFPKKALRRFSNRRCDR